MGPRLERRSPSQQRFRRWDQGAVGKGADAVPWQIGYQQLYARATIGVSNLKVMIKAYKLWMALWGSLLSVPSRSSLGTSSVTMSGPEADVSANALEPYECRVGVAGSSLYAPSRPSLFAQGQNV